MIKVKNVIELLKGTVLVNSPLIDREEVLIRLINLGVSEICRKFTLIVNSETLTTECNTYYYRLYNEDANCILGIYDEEGKEIPTVDVKDTEIPSYKLISTVSFTLNKPKNSRVTCVYVGTPEEITSSDDKINIPRAFETALIMYVGYLANTAVNAARDDLIQADTYQKRYLAECETLVMEGYKVDINTETYSTQYRGYV